MTKVDETLDTLEREKEKIWNELLKTQWGSEEATKITHRYVNACRQIHKYKLLGEGYNV